MKIVFFGTSVFAGEILKFLLSEGVEVAAIVTQTDKPRNNIPPVKKVACEYASSIPLYQPEKATDVDFIEEMKKYNPDLFVVVAYGKILRQSLLNVPSIDSINIHASLLPKFRGAAPIQRVLMEDEEKTGITIMKVVREMDAGDIISQKEIAIDDDTDFGVLQEKLCDLAKPMILDVIKKYEKGEVQSIVQDESKVTYADKITPEDLKLDFLQKTARENFNLIRGLSPVPGARFFALIGSEKKLIKVLKAKVVNIETSFPAKILKFEKFDFIVGCKEGALKIELLQPEGKKKMESGDFIRGVRGNISVFIDGNVN